VIAIAEAAWNSGEDDTLSLGHHLTERGPRATGAPFIGLVVSRLLIRLRLRRASSL
jgi:hypothetical protein